MKKLLILHTFYRQFGGEDSNLHDELNLLSKNFEVELLTFSNKKK